jgi:hypothetical protein
MYFNWFTTAFIMYGLALSWENLTGGLFLNFLIGTILDFPAKTLAMVLVLKCGRKYPYMVCQGITGKSSLNCHVDFPAKTLAMFLVLKGMPGNIPA